MTYFEDEILRELQIGELYTSRQLRIFIENNNAVIITRSNCQLSEYSDHSFIVKEIIEGYEHRLHNFSYYIPNSENKYYIVE
jgi:hypothetical protein